MKKCNLFKEFDKGSVQCIACSHRCVIKEGSVGICGVRKNLSNELYLLVYNKPISKNVDPIEKKPLYHFLPNTKSFSIGTFGCNFKCDFCQNYDISQFREFYSEEILNRIPKTSAEEIVSDAIKSKCNSISYTYTEPVIFIEFVYECSRLAKKKGLKNVWVTNGYMTKEALEYMTKEALIDAMNIDLKSFSEEYYNRLCGAKLKPVIDTIKRAYEKKIHIEITTLIVNGENDSREELEKIAGFIASVDKSIPWHVSRFFPTYKMINKKVTSIDSLKMAKEIGEAAGLKYVYVGNV